MQLLTELWSWVWGGGQCTQLRPPHPCSSGARNVGKTSLWGPLGPQELFQKKNEEKTFRTKTPKEFFHFHVVFFLLSPCFLSLPDWRLGGWTRCRLYTDAHWLFGPWLWPTGFLLVAPGKLTDTETSTNKDMLCSMLKKTLCVSEGIMPCLYKNKCPTLNLLFFVLPLKNIDVYGT